MAMTEAKWLRTPRPGDMLSFLRQGKPSARKLRLYAVASSRRCNFERPGEEKAEELAVIALAERFADGLATSKELAEAARCRFDEDATWCVAEANPFEGAQAFTTALSGQCKQSVKAALLRDVFGNPFREVAFDPVWRTPAVASLAAAAYEERLTPSLDLDPVRLSILADALEEGGCAEALITHLRSRGPHVRGCWALDLILAKG